MQRRSLVWCAISALTILSLLPLTGCVASTPETEPEGIEGEDSAAGDMGTDSGATPSPVDSGASDGVDSGADAGDERGDAGALDASDASDAGTAGAMCEMEGASCASGESCCDGLRCCVGIPVPPGEEFCGLTCPRSDRNIKENFTDVDSLDILKRVAALPITSWNFIDEGADTRHIGPMAQDFRASFSVGPSDRHIATIDADGVALSAIQALYEQVRELHSQNIELRREVEAIRLEMQSQR